MLEPVDVLEKILRSKQLREGREGLKRRLGKILGNHERIIQWLRQKEMELYEQIASVVNGFREGSKEQRAGVNLFGYFTAELGIGEAARASARSLKSIGINSCLVDIKTHSSHRRNDTSFSEFSHNGNPYGINLIHVNMDLLPRFYLEKGRNRFRNKYNIGFWMWELSEFPQEWMGSFRYCQEVWTASNFAREAISKKSPIPVFRIPLAVQVDKIKNVDRSYFGLRGDEFVFLFMFDFFSYFERKNPIGLIQSFKKAFLPSEKVRLVIKCSNSSFDLEAFQSMKESAKGLKVNFMDGYLDRDEVNALVSHSDCYVSLHRSEGFGLTMAEAMYLGKPVIATGYSGNTDFMNASNSYLVRYQLTEIKEDVGPYKKGNWWAEPNTGHASSLMRSVYENMDLSQKVGQSASEYIRRELSYGNVGRKINDRLSQFWDSG